jgi:hypothetical protein
VNRSDQQMTEFVSRQRARNRPDAPDSALVRKFLSAVKEHKRVSRYGIPAGSGGMVAAGPWFWNERYEYIPAQLTVIEDISRLASRRGK